MSLNQDCLDLDKSTIAAEIITKIAFKMLETTFPSTSAIVSDAAWMRFLDVVRTWFGRGSDVVRMWFGCGSHVSSDLVQTVWQKLRKSGFQHAFTQKSSGTINFEKITKQSLYKANSFHVLLQTGKQQWQQYCKENALVE